MPRILEVDGYLVFSLGRGHLSLVRSVLSEIIGGVMGSSDLINILGIIVNLVSSDRTVDQESEEVRAFKVATSKLIARFNADAAATSKSKVEDIPARVINDYYR